MFSYMTALNRFTVQQMRTVRHEINRFPVWGFRYNNNNA